MRLRLFMLVVIATCLLTLTYVIYLAKSGSKLRISSISTASPLFISIDDNGIASTAPGLAIFRGLQDESTFRSSDDPPQHKQEQPVQQKLKTSKDPVKSVVNQIHEIEIWGKASIAEYLWTHILSASNISISTTNTYANGLLKHGELLIGGDLHFRFRSGPGIVPHTVPATVKNLVLVLNANEPNKIKFARFWLDYLDHLPELRRTALVILGSESCENKWLERYLRSQGGRLDVVFLVYDSPLIGQREEIIQWPLGVATYRGFPHFSSHQVPLTNQRKHLCSFVGTVHRNVSSRESLMRVLRDHPLCLLDIRDTWTPQETYSSMDRYLKTLTESDLTLSPSGRNAECYRIYEALALGSVPVIVENDATPNSCCVLPLLRLLKHYNAPAIYLKDWMQLPQILDLEKRLTLQQRVTRRKEIVAWYEKFKLDIRQVFINTIRNRFFKLTS